MKASDVNLLLSVIDIATKAMQTVRQLKQDNPEAYAYVDKHHRDALAALEAANASQQ